MNPSEPNKEPESGVSLESQPIFEQLFESSPDAILVADQQGRVLRVNAQVEKLFGYSRAELISEPVETLMPQRFRATHLFHRRIYSEEMRMRPMGAGLALVGRRKDGTEFPVDIMLSPVSACDATAVIAVIRDVTERKRAEDLLRQSEERFRLLVEGVRDYAIFMLDPQGRVTSWNPGAERIKGYSSEEVIGGHFSVFYTREDVERGKPARALEMSAAQGRFEDEGWRVRKDGSRFWANVVITALRDDEGQLRGFSKLTRDFTERKHADEALLLQVTNALVSNLDIRKLLSAVSAGIRELVNCDHAGLALYDPDSNRVRLYPLDSFDQENSAEEAMSFEREEWPVFAESEPILINQLHEASDRFPAEMKEHWTRLQLVSLCWLPLVHGGRLLGALILAGHRERWWEDTQLDLLSRLSRQVAVAIDNAEAFRRVAELKDRLAGEKLYLEEELRTEYNFGEIVGESAALKRVLKQVETVGPTDATVLILGETGTGKELIARAIHDLSGRRERTFVKLNCAAIPGGLLESELFGHEKGAFTGAISQKIGRLELAHQGSLFLDEVGDIPLELQPKLLRALQEKELERLGSTRTIPIDVRLIAATNRDVKQMVQDRQFRSDLYYRLRVFPIEVPPLRQRAEDIPLLVHHFVHKHARRMNKRIESIPAETMQVLERWSWPGNVRELENLIERAVILTRGPALRVPLSELSSAEGAEPTAAPLSTLESAEREHILRVLRETKGLIAGPHGAAARLGLKRTTLNFKMKKLGISRKDL